MKKERIYVLDTSILIHDPDCLKGFHDTFVAIPIFVVMELDDLKDGHKFEVAAAARAASRGISTLRQLGSLHDPEGVKDPNNGTTYYVVADKHGVEALKETGTTRNMDLLILNAALSVKERHPDKETILITKDINLRILADAEGLIAEDYERDRVPIEALYRGYRFVSEFDTDLLAKAYIPKSKPIPIGKVGLDDLKPNEFVIFDNGEVKHLFRNQEGYLKRVGKEFRSTGIDPRNLEQRMALDLLLDPEIQLVTLVGKAGTGKTFLALASALAQLRTSRGEDAEGYTRILLSKPTVAMGNSDIGFLPGGVEDKMQPWMQSFFDNLDQLITTEPKVKESGRRNWDYLLQTGTVEIQTIYTIRGRSIPEAIMFIDEAQNLTPHEIKTIITRAAKGTKVVLSGDPFQCDSRFLDQHSNGITYVTERMQDEIRFGTVFIEHGVRSELSDLAATLL